MNINIRSSNKKSIVILFEYYLRHNIQIDIESNKSKGKINRFEKIEVVCELIILLI